MRKFHIFIITALMAVPAGAQDAQSAAAAAAQAISQAPAAQKPEVKPSYWTTSLDFDLGFNQTGLWHWASGGYKTMALSTSIDGQANYAKDLTSWGNRLQLQYGFLWSEDKAGVLQKSNDRIYLESKFGYKTGKDSKWSYTAGLDFRTQFTKGFKSYDTNGGVDPLSNFFAPAYLNLALGMSWKPNAWFDLNLAPVTGGIVFCNDPEFRAAYSMPLMEDGTYKSALFQFGAQLKANVKVTLNDNLGFESQLVLFTDYLNKPFVQTRVNWDNKISWRMAKFFKIGFDTWLIYDPLVTIEDRTSMVQFKEFLSINFSYTIHNKKK